MYCISAVQQQRMVVDVGSSEVNVRNSVIVEQKRKILHAHSVNKDPLTKACAAC